MVNAKKVKLLLAGAMLAFTTVIANIGTLSGIMKREAVRIDIQLPVPGESHRVSAPSMKYDVILNSYMRSGSSFLGEILGFRNDTFYFYEPLWKRHRWEYVRGRDKICHSLHHQCKNLTGRAREGDEGNGRRSSVSDVLKEDLSFLGSLYDCQYPPYARYISPTSQRRHAGPKWMSFYECSSQENADRTKCLEADVHHCREASHRASKVLRLTLDNLTPLLEQRPNLKIIHLFRDPRGILNSHLHTRWFPLHRLHRKVNSDIIRDDVMTLCDRMMYDIKAVKQVKKSFPDRFRIVQYEDLEDIPMKSGIVFDYLGMSYTPSDRRRVVFSSKGKLRKQTPEGLAPNLGPNAWRKSLPWDHISIIDSICKDVYNELGYKAFANKEAFKDLDNPSMETPLPFVLR